MALEAERPAHSGRLGPKCLWLGASGPLSSCLRTLPAVSAAQISQRGCARPSGKDMSADPNPKTPQPQARVFRGDSTVSVPPLGTAKVRGVPAAPGKALTPSPH